MLACGADLVAKLGSESVARRGSGWRPSWRWRGSAPDPNMRRCSTGPG